MTAANEKPWRIGRKVGRTIYDATDKLIGVMDTPELAALVTTAVNRYLSRAQPAEAVDERAIAESAWEAGYISAQQDERYPPAPPLPDHVFEMIMANARARGGK